MYAWIEGRLEHSEPTYVVVSAHGVGYMLTIPLRTFAGLPAIGSALRLYTSFQVRENSQALYGFASETERRCFDTLLHITGIGPKVALSILGHLTPEALYTALYTQDVRTLCAIPGIGKKSAERLLMEMRDRCQEQMQAVAAEGLSGASAGAGRAVGAAGVMSLLDPISRDARDALVQLGYSVVKAEQAVKATLKTADAPMTLSTLITRALKEI